jgi:alpha-L-fucosidase
MIGVLIVLAAVTAPAAPEDLGRNGTLYVSKLGDNTDGSSWAKAFHTIQGALHAVPNERGGFRIVVRPDTYMEAMLSPAHRGAEGGYNELVGDVDGRYGSGAKGWVVLDSGDPKQGFKSYDWWGPIRSNEKGWSEEHTEATFSAIAWDRWVLRNLYVTGGDAGLFWDLTDQVKPFSLIVEDSVGIGRAFGGGVAHGMARPGEPTVFRRCKLWALDWWGDTAGAYVRYENESMPEQPDIFFEDCTMASPQCAVKGGNFGFTTSTRIHLDRCRLVALNFSQPHGTPIDGAIQSVEQGQYLAVDLKDTTVMGYKVFGVRVNKDTANEIQISTAGNCAAYVQYQQDVPEGFYRLQQWPGDVFSEIAPPNPNARGTVLEDVHVLRENMCEVSSVVWKDRLCHMYAVRPSSGGTRTDYWLQLEDAESGEVLARFAEGYGLASAFVHDDTFYAFASRFADKNWNDVTVFSSKDLKQWDSRVAITQEDEHLFNSTVCAGPDGFVMAYESNDPAYPAFTTKFARSTDLLTWEKLPDATFGLNRYTACPWIQYADGFYYVVYLERRSPRHFYETYITRSANLRDWELSGANPVLRASGLDEGINASDADLVEFEGKTHVTYAVGDQLSWMNVKQGVYDGTLPAFLASWYAQPGVPDAGSAVEEAKRMEKQERVAWFKDAKFGIFVHWGLYALHAKNDAGPYVSWAMHQEKIPVSEYEPYADQFNPQRFDADAWMSLVIEAGARYMTFTSKHHEGFSLFDSALSDYDSQGRVAKRDYVRELVDAARRADLKISFYYSMLDWYHPDFKNDLSKYVDEFLFGQVEELCTNYGPIDGIWFDGEWDHPQETWRAAELVERIHTLQPNALVNDRLGKAVRGRTDLADFYTREQPHEIDEMTEAEREAVIPWEACMTIGQSWGYRHDDGEPKSSAELIRYLVDVVSRGGNLLLNVGPTADGEIPDHLAERLRDIGRWLSQNGEAIYGTRAVQQIKPSAGRCTMRDSTLYLHLDESVSSVTLSGLDRSIEKAWWLATGETVAIDDSSNTLSITDALPDPAVSVIAVALADEEN